MICGFGYQGNCAPLEESTDPSASSLSKQKWRKEADSEMEKSAFPKPIHKEELTLLHTAEMRGNRQIV